MARLISYTAAIREAMETAMQLDPKVLCYGLGVDDPKRIFGTTAGLRETFGGQRVFDMPTAENAMTGVGIGAALRGYKPVMVHQRLDFFLLAMDQLVNAAAKWHYMFGGACHVPITIRLILGQGWGQGPTHAQALQSWFAHVPGLKVVMPTTPADAKGLLLASIFDPNPVVFLEHRWLHNTEGEVDEAGYRIPIGRATRRSEGDDITLVTDSYLSVEAAHACRHMAKQGIHCDHVDLRSIAPLDWKTVLESVRRTGALLVAEGAHRSFSVSAELLARVAEELHGELRLPPRRLTLPDLHSPSSAKLIEAYYPRAEHIVDTIGTMLGKDLNGGAIAEVRQIPGDIPGGWFKGPF